MNQEEIILSALEQTYWQAMRELADWHEENGDAQIAAGYRWLLLKKRKPRHRREGGKHGYAWYSFCPERGLIDLDDLPIAAAGSGWHQFPTQGEAIWWAARKVDIWLNSKKRRKCATD